MGLLKRNHCQQRLSHMNLYDKIVSAAKYIHKHCNTDLKWFFTIDENQFGMDAKKVNNFPLEFAKSSIQDECWLFVDLATRDISFTAYDVKSYITKEKTNSTEGNIAWGSFEKEIYQFLLNNLKELCNTPMPYKDLFSDPENKDVFPSANRCAGIEKYDAPKVRVPVPSTTTSYNYNRNENVYDHSAYKRREDFYDGVYDLVKKNHTSSAVDFLEEKIASFAKKEKWEDLNIILKNITFDKLNITTMIEMLSITKVYEEKLTSRAEFLDKVEKYLHKFSPEKTGNLIHE